MLARVSKKGTGALLWATAFVLTGCGGGEGGGGSSGGGSGTTYTVSATVSGLVTGTTLVLQDNGGDNLSVTANGTIAFNTALKSGASYTVTVLTQPTGETCAATAGSGMVSNSNINVAVACTPMSYTLGGSVSGLLTGQSVVLQNNGTSTTVSANGTFAFSAPLASGTSYAVTVSTQPTGETCTATNGSGTVSGANVTNIAVACVANQYAIGVNVIGLIPSSNLVLKDNGSDTLTVTTGGKSNFTQKVASGSPYAVTIATQPSGQTCAVTSGSGTVTSVAVSVTVTCPWHVLYTGAYLAGDVPILSGFAVDPTSGAIAPLPISTATAITGGDLVLSIGLNHDSSGKHLYSTIGWGPNSSRVSEEDFYLYDVDSGTGGLTVVGSPLLIYPASFQYTSLLINPSGNFAYGQTSGTLFTHDSTTGVLATTSTTDAWAGATLPSGNVRYQCAIGPSGAFGYCVSGPNLVTSPTQGVVTQFSLDSTTGAATAVANVAAGAFPQQIVVTPNGKFVYVLDGANIWAYSIDGTTGALTPVGSGPVTYAQTIRQFAVNPNSNALYVVSTGGVSAFSIDSGTGALALLPGGMDFSPGTALVVDSSGKYLYASGFVSTVSNQIYGASLDPVTGAMTPLAGNPYIASTPGVQYQNYTPVTLDIVPIVP